MSGGRAGIQYDRKGGGRGGVGLDVKERGAVGQLDARRNKVAIDIGTDTGIGIGRPLIKGNDGISEDLRFLRTSVRTVSGGARAGAGEEAESNKNDDIDEIEKWRASGTDNFASNIMTPNNTSDTTTTTSTADSLLPSPPDISDSLSALATSRLNKSLALESQKTVKVSV